MLEARAKDGKKKKKKGKCKVGACRRKGSFASPFFTTIEISCSAIEAHAAHGDTICAPGPCTEFNGCTGSTCQYTNVEDGTPCQAGDATGECTAGVCGP